MLGQHDTNIVTYVTGTNASSPYIIAAITVAILDQSHVHVHLHATLTSL